MNELKFNSAVCTTREQSQRLLELGLKPETADMYYHEGSEDGAGNIEYHLNIRTERDNILFPDYIPAWSLHRLLSIGVDGDYMGLWNININRDTVGDLFEQFIKLIEWAIKDGAFNKEYLKL